MLNKNNNLRIAMLELSDQNRAVLDFYFSSTGRDHFSVVDEDKAETFITDYDYPGAKDHVAKLLSTSNKPVIILSVREQNIPSTIWLAKPLTADALTKSADSVKQMIAANAEIEIEVETAEEVEVETVEETEAEVEIVEETASETSKNETLITETSVDEVSTVNISSIKTSSVGSKNNEVIPSSSVGSPVFAGDLDDDEDDIFDSLDEDLDEDEIEDLDVYKKVKAQLTMAGAATLASVAISTDENSDEDTDNREAEATAENKEIVESSHLEFTEVLLDNNSQQISEKDPDNEIDDLLNSLLTDSEEEIEEDLISDIDNDNADEINNLEIEDDIFLNSLLLDEELNTDISVNSETDDTVDLSHQDDTDLEEPKLEITLSEKLELDNLDNIDTFDLLDEDTDNLDDKNEIDSNENISDQKESEEVESSEIENTLLSETKSETEFKTETESEVEVLQNDSLTLETDEEIPFKESKSEDTKAEEFELDTLDILDENILDFKDENTLDEIDESTLDEKNENSSVDIESTQVIEEEKESLLIDDDLIIDIDLDFLDTGISLLEPDSESINPEEVEIDEFALLDESITLEKEKPILIEEKESLLIDESFTLHDDKNNSDVDSFAATLEVDYTDLKTDESDKIVSTIEPIIQKEIKLETLEQLDQLDSLENKAVADTLKIDNLNVDANESLETDLFNFDLEQTDLTSATSDTTDNPIVPSGNDALTLLDETVDSSVNADIDSLLAEVSGETDEYEESEPKVIETPSLVEEIPLISDDFEVKSELPSSAKGDADFNLQSLLNEVREEASHDTGDDSEGYGGNNNNKSTYDHTKAEKRWMQLCGNNKNINTGKEVAKISFKLKDHLLGILLKQLKATKGSEQLFRLKYNDLIIVIDHSQDSIYCNLPTSTEEYSEVCFAEIEHKQIKIHDLDYSEIRLYRNKIKENPERAHSIESFIWVTSLLTSRGRLPEKTDINKKVGLKVWPNLTRAELTPHAMNIAAVFSKHPGSLLEVSKWLKIEQKYVFAFYNAALSLGMMELDSSKLKKSSFAFGKNNSKEKSESRGFFGRLLKRLKS